MGNLLGRCTGKIINPEQKLPSWNEDSLALCSQASRDLMSQVWEVTQRFSVSNFLSRKSIMFNFALVCSRKPQVNWSFEKWNRIGLVTRPADALGRVSSGGSSQTLRRLQLLHGNRHHYGFPQKQQLPTSMFNAQFFPFSKANLVGLGQSPYHIFDFDWSLVIA